MTRRAKKALALIIVIAMAVFFPMTKVFAATENEVNLYFFYEEICSHCQAESEYLDTLETTYPNIVIHRYEVNTSQANEELFESVREVFGKTNSLTPFLVIGGVALIGFSDQTETDIDSLITRYTETEHVDVVAKIIAGEHVSSSDIEYLRFSEGDYVNLPIIGLVPVDSVSLFLAAIVIGLVDGFNPCAMWILLFLITLLFGLDDKKRRWALGIAFLLTSGIFYYLIMVAWFNIGLSVASVAWVRIAIATFALVFGLYNLVSFIRSAGKHETGCEVTNVSTKRKIQERIRKVVAMKNIFPAILGIMLIAIAVNFLELACSAGLPLLYTQILAYREVSTAAYLFYIFIYVFFFLIDDIAVFVASMATLQVKAISNRFGKISKLLGGIIMLVIGVLLMFFPGVIMLG